MSDAELRINLTWGGGTLEITLSGLGSPQVSFSPQKTQAPSSQQPPAPHGNALKFALTHWTLPQTAAQAQTIGANIDNDPQNRPKNAFGNIITVFTQQDIDFGTLAVPTEASSAVMLLRLQTIDSTLRNDANTNVAVVPGRRSDDGTTFTTEPQAQPVSFFGSLVQGRFVSDPHFGPASPLKVIMPSPLALQFNLMAARLNFTATSATELNGTLQGVAAEDEFKDAFASAFANQVATQPGTAVTTALLQLFDQNSGDLTSVDDWRQVFEQDNLIKNLMQPDVIMNGQSAFSFGAGFSATAY